MLRHIRCVCNFLFSFLFVSRTNANVHHEHVLYALFFSRRAVQESINIDIERGVVNAIRKINIPLMMRTKYNELSFSLLMRRIRSIPY